MEKTPTALKMDHDPLLLPYHGRYYPPDRGPVSAALQSFGQSLHRPARK